MRRFKPNKKRSIRRARRNLRKTHPANKVAMRGGIRL